jgi:hypothetical protein
MKRTVRTYQPTALLICFCVGLIACVSSAAITAGASSKNDLIRISSLARSFFDAKTLTVKVKGEQDKETTVLIVMAGCKCGKCSEGKLCPSGCCDCTGTDCVCCIVAKGTTDGGVTSFRLDPGQYDVLVKADDKTTKVADVTISTKDKMLKFSMSDFPRPEKN